MHINTSYRLIVEMKKGDEQNAVTEMQEKVEAEWQVEQDDEAAIGSNLFYGSSTMEGNGSVYVLDIGMYGGKPVEEDDRYNIYRMKEGEWELFVSHPPYTTDVNSISNLVYWDGYIYYVLRKTSVWEGRTSEDNYIYRVSEDDGQTEWLSLCDVNFYIYAGEIYFKYQEKGTRYFYKMKLDGEEIELLYSDSQKDFSDFDYTVSGCLYFKDEEGILGINLETGMRKKFETSAEHTEGMFYEGERKRDMGFFFFRKASCQLFS